MPEARCSILMNLVADFQSQSEAVTAVSIPHGVTVKLGNLKIYWKSCETEFNNFDLTTHTIGY